MKKKPVFQPAPHKPKRIVMPAPEDLSAEALEAWQQAEEDAPEAYRQGNFLILYNREEASAMVADLNSKTIIRHFGSLGEVSSILNAIQNVKAQGERIYTETFQSLEDDEFTDIGMKALDEMMGEDVPPDLPAVNPNELLDSLRANFLDELIKPPKKP